MATRTVLADFHQPRACAALALVLSLLMTSVALGEDWSQWRGSSRDGTAALEIPAAWPEVLDLVWEQTVGEGLSSPVVLGERAYLHSREGDLEVVSALALESGREIWRQTLSAPFEYTDPSTRQVGMGPRATPAVSEGRVFVFTISGTLVALDQEDGGIAWSAPAARKYSRPYPKHGHAASPLVVGDKVIVHQGDDTSGELNAYAVSSGRRLWSFDKGGPKLWLARVGADRRHPAVGRPDCAVAGGPRSEDRRVALACCVLQRQLERGHPSSGGESRGGGRGVSRRAASFRHPRERRGLVSQRGLASVQVAQLAVYAGALRLEDLRSFRNTKWPVLQPRRADRRDRLDVRRAPGCLRSHRPSWGEPAVDDKRRRGPCGRGAA